MITTASSYMQIFVLYFLLIRGVSLTQRDILFGLNVYPFEEEEKERVRQAW